MWNETDRFENWFVTSLQTSINDTTTEFRINKIPNVVQGRLVINPYDEDNREIIYFDGRDGNLLQNVVRGDDHTEAGYHLEGELVVMDVVGADLNDLYAQWAETEENMAQAIEDAETATEAAEAATIDANAAAADANDAAADATTATGLANTATSNANTATSNANTATGNANTATTNANNAASDANAAAAAANAIVSDMEDWVLDHMYPVGAIYTSVVSTSPATLFGGTWSAFAAGRVLVGLDSGQTEFDTVEETGGAKTHTLTQAEMPAHSHTQNIHSHGNQYHGTSVAGYGHIDSGSARSSGQWSTDGTTATNQNTGGGGAHNNLQPYIVVYMWKRTA